MKRRRCARILRRQLLTVAGRVGEGGGGKGPGEQLTHDTPPFDRLGRAHGGTASRTMSEASSTPSAAVRVTRMK